MAVLFKYFFLSLTALSLFICTVSCSRSKTPTPDTPAPEADPPPVSRPPVQQENPVTLNTDILYIIRDKNQTKRIWYVLKNNSTPFSLHTLMSPDMFCVKIKKSDFNNNIQKIGLSSDMQELNHVLCSNEQQSDPTVPKCDLKSYRITNLYKLETLNLNDSNTIQLIKKDYDCFEYVVPWL